MPSTASARNVLVVLGHPSSTSLSAALAQAYADGARAAGHQVRMLRLGELAFDPVLHGSNPHLQPLEADLRAAQEDMQWAQHMAWVFPVWWGSVPALLKGFLDRAFTSGYAYKFQPGASFPTPLMRGRTADLLVPLDTPPWYYRWIYRMPAVHQMRKTTLDFCGIRTRRTQLWGPVIHSHAPQRAQWLEEAQALGRSV